MGQPLREESGSRAEVFDTDDSGSEYTDAEEGETPTPAQATAIFQQFSVAAQKVLHAAQSSTLHLPGNTATAFKLLMQQPLVASLAQTATSHSNVEAFHAKDIRPDISIEEFLMSAPSVHRYFNASMDAGVSVDFYQHSGKRGSTLPDIVLDDRGANCTVASAAWLRSLGMDWRVYTTKVEGVTKDTPGFRGKDRRRPSVVRVQPRHPRGSPGYCTGLRDRHHQGHLRGTPRQ